MRLPLARKGFNFPTCIRIRSQRGMVLDRWSCTVQCSTVGFPTTYYRTSVEFSHCSLIICLSDVHMSYVSSWSQHHFLHFSLIGTSRKISVGLSYIHHRWTCPFLSGVGSHFNVTQESECQEHAQRLLGRLSRLSRGSSRRSSSSCFTTCPISDFVL